jgi:c-di-GMP-related signal transduction protein
VIMMIKFYQQFPPLVGCKKINIYYMQNRGYKFTGRLNIKVLAEGVENNFQKDFIIAYGCDYAQGYYYKPLDTPDKIFVYVKNLPQAKIKNP